MKKGLVIATLAIACVIAYVLVRQSRNTTLLGSTWDENSLISTDRADHSDWDKLLQKYVDDDGLVNYRAWHSSRQDRQQLEMYLDRLSLVDVSLPAKRASQLAFWINAYNALTVYGILEVYPTSSIRRHTNPIGYNIWTHLKLLVGGRAYSLNDIEHNVLRKMEEPRIHFAIVCASMSCPRLLNRAYTSSELERQLVENTRHFFNQPHNLRVEGSKRIHLNSILKWFAEDFGDTKQQQRDKIASYIDDDDARQLVRSADIEISYIPYDWSINQQK